MHQHPHDTSKPPIRSLGALVSPNGGLKAAPSPPQKENSEHTRQKEVNSTFNGLVVCSILSRANWTYFVRQWM